MSADSSLFSWGTIVNMPTGLGFANSAGTGTFKADANGFVFTGTVTMPTLSWVGPLDLTVAATTTEQALNSDITMNSASAVGVAGDFTYTQLTTARSSGYGAALRAKTTSIAADVGVFACLYNLAPTDGGSVTAKHVGVYDAGNDIALFATDTVSVGWGTGNGASPDVEIGWDGTRLQVSQLAPNSEIRWGVDGAGFDHIFYGDTASTSMTWDQSADSLIFTDAAKAVFGTGSDITFAWDGTRFNVTQAASNSEIRWGVDGAGLDQIWYGDTASASMTWDQSADKLIFGGVAKLQFQTIAAATGTAIPVTHSGSFPITTAAAETNTLADPTYVGQWMELFCDTYAVGDRVVTAASRINKAGNTIMTFGAAGDFIRLSAITIGGALKWQVVSNDGVALS